MKPLAKEIDAYWRVTAMAQATKTGVVRACQDGRLDQDMWSDMVKTCRTCSWAESCDEWVENQREIVSEPPHQCLNKDCLMTIKEG